MAAEQRSVWGCRFDLLSLKCSGQGPLTSSARGALLPNLPPAQWSTLGLVTCVGLLNSAVPGAVISLSHTSLPSDDSTHSLKLQKYKTHTYARYILERQDEWLLLWFWSINILNSLLTVLLTHAHIRRPKMLCICLLSFSVPLYLFQKHTHTHTHTQLIGYCGLTARYRFVSVFSQQEVLKTVQGKELRLASGEQTNAALQSQMKYKSKWTLVGEWSTPGIMIWEILTASFLISAVISKLASKYHKTKWTDKLIFHMVKIKIVY